ncbi:hypothetical protein C8J56DRAFT_957469 [Mycena floridula]|nr:hypothetical protein C8J56DRAFT_957469 [Mycena floridula]
MQSAHRALFHDTTTNNPTMPSDRESLLGMGFDVARVEWALAATSNSGLQPAMDHLFANEGNPVPDISSVKPEASSAPMDVDDDEDTEALRALGINPTGQSEAGGAEGAEAKSIKCTICSKVFRNTALAEFHAEKSGHDQFEESVEEIKPLTEEEKAARLAELKEKMTEKRAKKEEERRKEDKINEAIRRKAGKDLNKMKEELQAKEVLKEVEAKKREKIADAKARAAVKAQIEADKRERAAKAAKEKALRDGTAVPSTSSGPPTQAPAAVKTVQGDHASTRLQIRMNGNVWTTSLGSDEPLVRVSEFVAAQSLDVQDPADVKWEGGFPRKRFADSDSQKSLKELGLVPSAVLFASL